MGKLFKGLNAASTEMGRTDTPKTGTAHFLVTSVALKESTNPKTPGQCRTQISLTCLKGITEEGNEKGDRCATVLHMSNMYYASEFKRWLIALVRSVGGTEDTVVEMMAPASDHPKLSEEARAVLAWETIAQQTQGLDASDEHVGPGMFDGQVVVEVQTVQKPGKEVGKVFTNSYPVRTVPLSEVAEYLDDEDLTRFFGSEEKFTELLKSED